MADGPFSLGTNTVKQITPVIAPFIKHDDLTENPVRFGGASMTQEVVGVTVTFAYQGAGEEGGPEGQALNIIREFFGLKMWSTPEEVNQKFSNYLTPFETSEYSNLRQVYGGYGATGDTTVTIGSAKKTGISIPHLNAIRKILSEVTTGDDQIPRTFDFFVNDYLRAYTGKYTFSDNIQSTLTKIQSTLRFASELLGDFQKTQVFQKVDGASGALVDVPNYKIDKVRDGIVEVSNALQDAFSSSGQFYGINDGQGLDISKFNSDVSVYFGLGGDYRVVSVSLVITKSAGTAGQFKNALLYGYAKEGNIVLNVNVGRQELIGKLNKDLTSLLLLINHKAFLQRMSVAPQGVNAVREIGKYIHDFPDTYYLKDEEPPPEGSTDSPSVDTDAPEETIEAEGVRTVEAEEKLQSDIQAQVGAMELLQGADDIMQVYHSVLNFLDIQSLIAQLLNCAMGSFDLVDALTANCKALFKLAITGSFDVFAVLYLVKIFDPASQPPLSPEDQKQATNEFIETFKLDREEFDKTIKDMKDWIEFLGIFGNTGGIFNSISGAISGGVGSVPLVGGVPTNGLTQPGSMSSLGPGGTYITETMEQHGEVAPAQPLLSAARGGEQQIKAIQRDAQKVGDFIEDMQKWIDFSEFCDLIKENIPSVQGLLSGQGDRSRFTQLAQFGRWGRDPELRFTDGGKFAFPEPPTFEFPEMPPFDAGNFFAFIGNEYLKTLDTIAMTALKQFIGDLLNDILAFCLNEKIDPEADNEGLEQLQLALSDLGKSVPDGMFDGLDKKGVCRLLRGEASRTLLSAMLERIQTKFFALYASGVSTVDAVRKFFVDLGKTRVQNAADGTSQTFADVYCDEEDPDEVFSTDDDTLRDLQLCLSDSAKQASYEKCLEGGGNPSQCAAIIEDRTENAVKRLADMLDALMNNSIPPGSAPIEPCDIIDFSHPSIKQVLGSLVDSYFMPIKTQIQNDLRKFQVDALLDTPEFRSAAQGGVNQEVLYFNPDDLDEDVMKKSIELQVDMANAAEEAAGSNIFTDFIRYLRGEENFSFSITKSSIIFDAKKPLSTYELLSNEVKALPAADGLYRLQKSMSAYNFHGTPGADFTVAGTVTEQDENISSEPGASVFEYDVEDIRNILSNWSTYDGVSWEGLEKEGVTDLDPSNGNLLHYDVIDFILKNNFYRFYNGTSWPGVNKDFFTASTFGDMMQTSTYNLIQSMVYNPLLKVEQFAKLVFFTSQVCDNAPFKPLEIGNEELITEEVAKYYSNLFCLNVEGIDKTRTSLNGVIYKLLVKSYLLDILLSTVILGDKLRIAEVIKGEAFMSMLSEIIVSDLEYRFEDEGRYFLSTYSKIDDEMPKDANGNLVLLTNGAYVANGIEYLSPLENVFNVILNIPYMEGDFDNNLKYGWDQSAPPPPSGQRKAAKREMCVKVTAQLIENVLTEEGEESLVEQFKGVYQLLKGKGVDTTNIVASNEETYRQNLIYGIAFDDLVSLSKLCTFTPVCSALSYDDFSPSDTLPSTQANMYRNLSYHKYYAVSGDIADATYSDTQLQVAQKHLAASHYLFFTDNTIYTTDLEEYVATYDETVLGYVTKTLTEEKFYSEYKIFESILEYTEYLADAPNETKDMFEKYGFNFASLLAPPTGTGAKAENQHERNSRTRAKNVIDLLKRGGFYLQPYLMYEIYEENIGQTNSIPGGEGLNYLAADGASFDYATAANIFTAAYNGGDLAEGFGLPTAGVPRKTVVTSIDQFLYHYFENNLCRYFRKKEFGSLAVEYEEEETYVPGLGYITMLGDEQEPVFKVVSAGSAFSTYGDIIVNSTSPISIGLRLMYQAPANSTFLKNFDYSAGYLSPAMKNDKANIDNSCFYNRGPLIGEFVYTPAASYSDYPFSSADPRIVLQEFVNFPIFDKRQSITEELNSFSGTDPIAKSLGTQRVDMRLFLPPSEENIAGFDEKSYQEAITAFSELSGVAPLDGYFAVPEEDASTPSLGVRSFATGADILQAETPEGISSLREAYAYSFLKDLNQGAGSINIVNKWQALRDSMADSDEFGLFFGTITNQFDNLGMVSLLSSLIDPATLEIRQRGNTSLEGTKRYIHRTLAQTLFGARTPNVQDLSLADSLGATALSSIEDIMANTIPEILKGLLTKYDPGYIALNLARMVPDDDADKPEEDDTVLSYFPNDVPIPPLAFISTPFGLIYAAIEESKKKKKGVKVDKGEQIAELCKELSGEADNT